MARVRVQTEDFDEGAELAELTAGRADIGGVGCFVGCVRDDAGGRRIVSMTLEDYPAMTGPALRAIAAEAERRWGLLACAVIHRVGELAPGDRIVFVAAAARRRQAALDATAFLIDWLKTRAPFWKKERFEDGAEEWVEGRAEDEAAAARWGPPEA